MIGVPIVGADHHGDRLARTLHHVGYRGFRRRRVDAAARRIAASSTSCARRSNSPRCGRIAAPWLSLSRGSWCSLPLRIFKLVTPPGWNQQFGLSTAARGTVQILFGVFEIAASLSSALFLDRIGKKRGVTGGLIVVLDRICAIGDAGIVGAMVGPGSDQRDVPGLRVQRGVRRADHG